MFDNHRTELNRANPTDETPHRPDPCPARRSARGRSQSCATRSPPGPQEIEWSNTAIPLQTVRLTLPKQNPSTPILTQLETELQTLLDTNKLTSASDAYPLTFALGKITAPRFTDELYTNRPPTRIPLRQGWNTVLIKSAPSWKWCFTFAPIQWDGTIAREAPGLRYSTELPN